MKFLELLSFTSLLLLAFASNTSQPSTPSSCKSSEAVDSLAFCGIGNCQSGNSARRKLKKRAPPPTEPPHGLERVVTTDGTCGGPNNYTCDIRYGYCCNKDGLCGSLPSDCGIGCQPQFGNCIISAPETRSYLPPSTARPVSSATTGIASLPSCGQTCMNNMIGQYSTLNCSSPDPYCLCNNINFSYGIRDCSNGACGTAVASTIIAYGGAYCAAASATHAGTTTPTGITSLPYCGQTCMNDMIGQYSGLGCSSPDAKCLCSNANFWYGIRDCSNEACGTAVASTVIEYGSSYCASATTAPK